MKNFEIELRDTDFFRFRFCASNSLVFAWSDLNDLKLNDSIGWISFGWKASSKLHLINDWLDFQEIDLDIKLKKPTYLKAFYEKIRP